MRAILILAALLAGAVSAHAQAAAPRANQAERGLIFHPPGQPGGQPAGSLEAAVRKLVEGTLLPDLKVASGRAEKRGNKVSKPCWDAIVVFIEAAKTPDDTPLPDPHVITAIEDLIDFHDAIQPGAPLMVACAPLKEKVRMDTRTFFLTLVGGGIAMFEKALTGGLLP